MTWRKGDAATRRHSDKASCLIMRRQPILEPEKGNERRPERVLMQTEYIAISICYFVIALLLLILSPRPRMSVSPRHRFEESPSRRVAAASLRLGLLLVVGSLLGSCSKEAERVYWQGPVRIAVVVPERDYLQEEGEMLRLGALMGMRALQDSVRDLKVEMAVYDSPCSAEAAAGIARRLAADPSLCAVIGYLCAEAVSAVLPVYQQAGLALINTAISAESVHRDVSRHLFPMLYSDSEQAAFLAAYAKKGLGLARVAVISDQSVYGQLLKASFLGEASRQGLELVAQIDIGPDETEAMRSVQLFKQIQPEAMFLATRKETARMFLLERNRQNLGGKVLGPDRLADLDFYEMAGQAAEGLLVCQPILLEIDTGEVGSFTQSFERLYKRRPDWIAAGGYDAMRLALEVLSRSGPSRSRFLQNLRAISGPESAFRSLSGPIFFEDDGACRRPRFVAAFHQGRLGPADPSSIEFPG